MRCREHKIFNPKYECMSRDELIAHQNEKLREVVKHEYENVKLYRERMDAKGIKPEDIRTIEDLRYLPFTEKTDLRDEFPYGLLAVPKEESCASMVPPVPRANPSYPAIPARMWRSGVK